LRLTTSNVFATEPFQSYSFLTSSLTRRLVCYLQLLLVLASAVILRSQYRETYDHISLSQIRDCPNLEGQVPYLYPTGTGLPGYTPRHWVPFCRLLRLAGLRWRYSSRPSHGPLTKQVKVKVTLRQTVSQSVSQSVSLSLCLAPSGAHDQIFITV
jgi:hypothetical protein